MGSRTSPINGLNLPVPVSVRQYGPGLGLLLIYLMLVSFNFGPYITDDHPFRQTQTALTARYMTGLTDLYTYLTPLFGPPWAVPFEFPLYQGLAKLLSVVSGVTLITAGRLVSVLFFLLCFWPIARLLDHLTIRDKLTVWSLILLTPIYVFWSRAFMIETTALFFTLWYLAEFVRIIDTPPPRGYRIYVWLLVAGLLAALVKATTFGPVFLCVNAVIGWRLLQALRRSAPVFGLLPMLLINMTVFIVTLWWIGHTDSVKALDPVATALQSAYLRDWNYGPLAQRFDWRIWMALINTTLDIYFPFARNLAWLKLSLGVLWIAVFVYGWRLCSAQRRRQILLVLLLFFLPYLIFTNLHRIHSYYQNANAVFLTMALGMALTGGMEGARTLRQQYWLRTLHGVLLLVFCGCSVWYFHFKSSHVGIYAELTRFVRQHTPEDAAIIVAGQDWSPVIPYLAERRALMLQEWPSPPMKAVTQGSLQKALVRMADAGVEAAAYIDCGNGEYDALIRSHYAWPAEPAYRDDRCRVNLLRAQ